MRYQTTSTWILIAGLSLVMPLYVTASNAQGEKATESAVEMPKRKPATDAASDGERQKSGYPEVESTTDKETSALEMPAYRPPLRGAPGGRVRGGTRGYSDKLTFLSVLAPDHMGRTVQEQPSLYWFISELASDPIELTVIEDLAIKPLLEIRLVSPKKPGIQCIRLADHGLRLQQNVPYRWFVALVLDPDRRSKDILGGGFIEYVEFPKALRIKLGEADRARTPHIFAEAGIWYDALAAISDLINSSPNDTVLRKQRASLLEQVGLPEIAQYEMGHKFPGRQ